MFALSLSFDPVEISQEKPRQAEASSAVALEVRNFGAIEIAPIKLEATE
jgi:hypothetical protein